MGLLSKLLNVTLGMVLGGRQGPSNDFQFLGGRFWSCLSASVGEIESNDEEVMGGRDERHRGCDRQVWKDSGCCGNQTVAGGSDWSAFFHLSWRLKCTILEAKFS